MGTWKQALLLFMTWPVPETFPLCGTRQTPEAHCFQCAVSLPNTLLLQSRGHECCLRSLQLLI